MKRFDGIANFLTGNQKIESQISACQHHLSAPFCAIRSKICPILCCLSGPSAKNPTDAALFRLAQNLLFFRVTYTESMLDIEHFQLIRPQGGI